MPTICRFLGIVIRMYHREHGPPHFHVYYGEAAAVLEIETLRVTSGHLPRRVLALVLEWAFQHRAELRHAKRWFQLHHWSDAMERVVVAKPLAGYRLWVEFSDGVSGEVDLSGELYGPVFEPLKDPAYFAQVTVDEFGAIVWPNGADLAPDALYDSLKKSA